MTFPQEKTQSSNIEVSATTRSDQAIELKEPSDTHAV